MLVDIRSRLPQMVFVYIRGTHHFPLIVPMAASNPDIDFYVHSEQIKVDEYRRSKLYRLENVHFIARIMDFKYKLNLFGAFITTDSYPTLAHLYAHKLIQLFNRIGVPVFELQHGMFQLGLHYFDMPRREMIAEDSLPLKTFADHVLAYYKPYNCPVPCTIIGYPPYCGECAGIDGEYVLVLSNLHWKTYSHEEKAKFYRVVFEYASRHENTVFLWKMHHGEVVNPNSKSIIAGMFERYPSLRQRIIFHHESELFSTLSVSDLIRRARYVISTVSTVLLDCEMYGKRTAVYQCPTNECLTSKMNPGSMFTDMESLERCCSEQTGRFVSGYLMRFDNVAFRNAIDQNYHVSEVSQKEWLEIVLSSMQTQNVELMDAIGVLERKVAALEKLKG